MLPTGMQNLKLSQAQIITLRYYSVQVLNICYFILDIPI